MIDPTRFDLNRRRYRIKIINKLSLLMSDIQHKHELSADMNTMILPCLGSLIKHLGEQHTSYQEPNYQRKGPFFEEVSFNFMHYQQKITLDLMLQNLKQRRLSEERRTGERQVQKVHAVTDKNLS